MAEKPYGIACGTARSAWKPAPALPQSIDHPVAPRPGLDPRGQQVAARQLALYHRTAPPTINLTEQDPAIPLDVVTTPRALGDGPLLALSNSFGFGGHNSVVVFRSYQASTS